MTYNFGTRQEKNTSFQKQEKVFYVFRNSYFGSPIRNGLRPLLAGVETRNIFWGDYQLFDTNSELRPFLVGVETRNIFWGDYQLFDTNILCFDASNFSNLMVSIGS